MNVARRHRSAAIGLAAASGLLIVVVGLALLGPDLPGPSAKELLGRAPTIAACTPAPSEIRLPAGPAPLTPRWRPEQALPRAHDELRAVAVGNSVVVGSGLEPGDVLGGLRSVATFYVFRPADGSFALLPLARERVDHPAIVAVGRDIYMFGGWKDGVPVRSAWRLTMGAGRWQPLPPLPAPRAAAAAVVRDGRIYVVGGSGAAHDTGTPPGSRSVYSYDIATQEWDTGPSLAIARHHHVAGVVDGEIVVAGGRDGARLALASVERLDRQARMWIRERPLPLGVGAAASAVVDGMMVVAGGGDDSDDGSGWVTPAAWEYRPGAGWARLANMRVARHGHGMAAVGRRVFVFGGSPCVGYGQTDSVESLEVVP
jgi:hypothetical protein